jgi:hypothetical protein
LPPPAGPAILGGAAHTTGAGSIGAWDDYRARARLFWLTVLGLIPAAVVIGLPLGALFQSGIPFAVVGIAWMAFFAVAGARLFRFPCPPCGGTFFCTPWRRNLFAGQCLHCRLPKWADPSAP